MKKILKNFSIALLTITILLLSSCSEDENPFGQPAKDATITLNSKSSDTLVYTKVGNAAIPVYIAVPESCDKENFPAVMVLHGSDGMWLDHDASTGKMSGQFNEWKELLNNNCIVAVFVDSYSGRGVQTRTGKWTTAPDNFKISSQFMRPRDANAALRLLQEMKFSNGKPVIRSNQIALVGFSDGASAVASTLYNTDTTPDGWQWIQTFDGKTYDTNSGVIPPEPKPEVGFAGGIFYYGGSGAYNYWGKSPCSDDAAEGNIFQPYAPMLYQVPSEGYLSENTLCQVALLKEKGLPVEVQVYQGVGHGFDFDKVEQSELARAVSIQWLKQLFANLED
jgi:dienelactone hydrolase